MKRLFAQWKEAWRISIYFIGFSIVCNFLMLPVGLGKIAFFKEHIIAAVIFYVCLGLFYLPFAILWSSKIANLRAPTQEEAKQKEIHDQERLNRQIQARNGR